MAEEQARDYSIEGMHCDACVRRLTTNLGKVPGVVIEAVQVGNARVKLSGPDADTAVRAAVEKAGFKVSGN